MNFDSKEKGRNTKSLTGKNRLHKVIIDLTVEDIILVGLSDGEEDDTIRAYPHNKVLGRTPPPLVKEEIDLSRKTRATLSQLRSGYSKVLNSYNNVLDETVPDECPLCLQTPHNTAHLFSFPANPTNLTVESLWNEPKKTATFLNLDMEHEPD